MREREFTDMMWHITIFDAVHCNLTDIQKNEAEKAAGKV